MPLPLLPRACAYTCDDIRSKQAQTALTAAQHKSSTNRIRSNLVISLIRVAVAVTQKPEYLQQTECFSSILNREFKNIFKLPDFELRLHSVVYVSFLYDFTNVYTCLFLV